MKKLLLLFALLPFIAFAQNNAALVLSDVHVALGKRWDTFYHSDTDTSLFESAVQHAGSKHYAYILMTGDLLRHVGDVGHDTAEMKATYQFVMQKVQRTDTAAIILPALGNNDCIQHDVPGTATYKVFYEGALKRIDRNGEIKRTFLTGGYYAYQKGNLSVLVLNSIVFMRKNQRFSADAKAELIWLNEKLSTLSPGQAAWLIYHVPPGNDRYDDVPSWQDSIQLEYLRIIKRYQSRIKLQLAGHTHTVDARLLIDSGRIASYIAIAPGLDSRNGNNPAYQVLKYHNKHKSVSKITTYYNDGESNFKWHSFTFKDLGFGFFLDTNKSSHRGQDFIKHYNTCRGTTNTKAGKIISWDEDFRNKTLIMLP